MDRDGSTSGTLPGVEFTRTQRRRGRVFLVGLVTGWLADRRGTLLAAGLAHGFVG